MNIDQAFDKIGTWGRYQTLLYMLIFFAGIPNAFLTIYFAISHHEMPHHCKLPEQTNYTSNGTVNAFSYSIPLKPDQQGNMKQSQCTMNKTSYNADDTMNKSYDITPCLDGWVFDTLPGETSPITEYNFVCEHDWKIPLSISIYQFGMILGSIMGTAADWIGRRPVFLLASFGQVVATIFQAVSWNYYSYLTAICLCGVTTLVNYNSAFVIGTEMIAPERRNFLSISSFYSFSIGYAAVSALAYLLPNWRTYCWVATLLTALVYLPYYWLFPESPRWLLIKERKNDSLKVLKKIAKINRLDIDFEQEEVEELKKKNEVDTDTKPPSLTNSLWILFRTPIKGRCIATMFGWFGVTLVYYSISLHMTSFSEDKYLNCLFGALSEFPSYFAAYYLVNILGRPRSVFLFMSLCGLSCIALPFIQKDHSIVLTIVSMLGKCGVSAAFYVYFLITNEVAPTLQRSTLMSISSSIGRVGSFVAPFLAYSGKIHYSIPNLSMGIIAIICAIVGVAFIPETTGVDMPDSLEEAMSNNRFYGVNIFRKRFKPSRSEGKSIVRLSDM